MVEVKDIPEFVNREEELKQFKALLSGRPNLIYFVYGPINSGKTALLMKVFEELPEDYVVFYVNFRWRYVEDVRDLIRVLFRVKREKGKLSLFLEKVLKGGAKLFERLGGIPIPEEIFDLLFRKSEGVEDVFAFLKDYFSLIGNKGYKAVFVLDEMQTIKEVINASGRPVIHELFNFLVGLTKETHLCHCLCATSDCLFIEDVYSNARLDGRARYVLVDDLSKEASFRVYEKFGFENKELVWDYIGGKLGDMVILFEEKKRGLEEEEALKGLLKNAIGKLKWFFRLIREGEKGNINFEDVRKILKLFKENIEVEEEKIKGKILKFLIEENILFYNPVEGTVRPQSRLIHRAIKEFV